jgi:hypothetical protein
MDLYALLKEAIEQKFAVTAHYDGLPRVFCPHALGTKRGQPHVLVFQYAGESRSGLPASGEWRCLDVDDLTEATLEPDEWHSASNVFNPQSCLDEIDVVVQPFPPVAPRHEDTA